MPRVRGGRAIPAGGARRSFEREDAEVLVLHTALAAQGGAGAMRECAAARDGLDRRRSPGAQPAALSDI